MANRQRRRNAGTAVKIVVTGPAADDHGAGEAAVERLRRDWGLPVGETFVQTVWERAKARALAAGREFVEPDDVKEVAEPVLAHRLMLAPEARSAGLTAGELVREALEHTPVPV